MKKLNNKGFTLAELLAVMAILIILLGIAIASYTRVILDASKDAFIAEANTHAQGIKQFIESEDIDVEDGEVTYYFDCKLGVNHTESPFEEWDQCYIVVIYDEASEKNSYYWTALDIDGWGVKLEKEITNLTKKDVENGEFEDINPNIVFKGRNKIVLIESDGEDDYIEISRDI